MSECKDRQTVLPSEVLANKIPTYLILERYLIDLNCEAMWIALMLW